MRLFGFDRSRPTAQGELSQKEVALGVGLCDPFPVPGGLCLLDVVVDLASRRR